MLLLHSGRVTVIKPFCDLTVPVPKRLPLAESYTLYVCKPAEIGIVIFVVLLLAAEGVLLV